MSFTLNFTGLRITDVIIASLSTSKAAYEAAPANALVPITSTEYAALAANLSGGVRAGVAESAWTVSFANPPQASAQGVMRNTGFGSSAVGSLMTAGYAVAMKSLFTTANSTATTNVQFGYGTTTNNAGIALSGLTNTTITSDANRFFYWVVKSPNVLVPSGAFPTMFMQNNISSFSGQAGNTQSFSTTATSALSAPVNNQTGMNGFQILQAPTIQWG
jgi:hypothetical protein